MKKSLTIISILIILAALAALGYFLIFKPKVEVSNLQAENYNWATYESEHGFEIKYPLNYFSKIDTERKPGTPAILLQSQDIYDTGAGDAGILIEYIHNKDIKIFIKEQIEYNSRFELPTPNFIEIIISGKKSYRFKNFNHNATSIAENDNVIIPVGQGILHIQIGKWEKINSNRREILSDKDIAIFDYIISTFKFRDFTAKAPAEIARLISLEITPSCQDRDGNIMYPKGAKLVATGENISKVEFKFSIPGTGFADLSYTGSPVTKINNQWEAVLNSYPRFTIGFAAIGYDNNGNEIDRIDINHNTGQSENYIEMCNK